MRTRRHRRSAEVSSGPTTPTLVHALPGLCAVQAETVTYDGQDITGFKSVDRVAFMVHGEIAETLPAAQVRVDPTIVRRNLGLVGA